jgi:hypothetical protein
VKFETAHRIQIASNKYQASIKTHQASINTHHQQTSTNSYQVLPNPYEPTSPNKLTNPGSAAIRTSLPKLHEGVL